MRALAAAVLCSSLVACGPSTPARSGDWEHPKLTSSAGILDLSGEFLETACRVPAGEPFARAWLAHEERHAEVYFPVFYPELEQRGGRAKLAEDLALRQAEVCGHARVFRGAAPSTIDHARREVQRVLGVWPQSAVVFAASLQASDGKLADVDGRTALVLNARNESFARTETLGLLITHELFHDGQDGLYGARARGLSPAALVLFREGGAVFGTTLVFPEAGDRALAFSNKELERARFALGKAAAELRDLVRSRAEGPPLQRFMRGGRGEGEMPARMAYFVGLEIFRAIARERGETAAARTTPEAFAAEVDRRLDALAR